MKEKTEIVATAAKATRPRVFLEDECPVAELSVEAQRERGQPQALPPLYFLHVWWARRPLTVSRSSLLGCMLPAGFPRDEFLQLMGIPKGADAVAQKERIAEANRAGRKLDQGFSYKRAFSNPIPKASLDAMRRVLRETWGTDAPTVLDSFAGGGSIPFEAYRLGFNAILNELNPVASVIERATIEYPAKFGPELAKDIEYWGNRIATEVEEDLAECFPKKPGEEIFAYIWVRTVACPNCLLQVPLAPNWWLDKTGKLGYQPEAPSKGKGNRCTFRIREKSREFDPNQGSIKGGVGQCPRCTSALDSDLIKAEAQSGHMGGQIVAVGFEQRNKKGRFFREVTAEDEAGLERAKKLLAERLPEWEARGLVPNDPVPEGNKTRELLVKGMTRWRDLFAPRQLLVHLATLDAILRQPWHEIEDEKRREALRVYVSIVLSKQLDWNSLGCTFISSQGRMLVRHTFQRHAFPFIFSPAEVDGAGKLQRWTVGQVVKAYSQLCSLLGRDPEGSLQFLVGDAASLPTPTASVTVVAIDPPYYDNVMYAELADFFYVWMKRSLGDVFPNLFSTELTDKDREAVANVARFKGTGRGKARGLADEDYTAKMRAAFAECHRVLRDDGVLTIMFTHKRVEAWDSLGRALIEAGFEITATWPVHTESEHSLHQAKKNAAASTILLVCRKRDPGAGTAWWEDIQDEVRSHVRESAEKFASMGLRGQDTSIASFGPALQVISRQWPVKRKDGTVISPDEALDIAREEVMTWMFQRIAEGHVKAVDKWTRFYILAWYTFGAREFPYDEARKLALSMKADLDKEVIPRGLIEKKSNNVRIVKPDERFRKGKLDAAAKSYAWDIDYVHAAIHAYEQGQSAELTRFHTRAEALKREGYINAIRYLLDGVLPRTDEVTEYHVLDKLWEANLQDRVKRKKPRTTDPTFEKQKRLGAFADDAKEGATGDESEEA